MPRLRSCVPLAALSAVLVVSVFGCRDQPDAAPTTPAPAGDERVARDGLFEHASTTTSTAPPATTTTAAPAPPTTAAPAPPPVVAARRPAPAPPPPPAPAPNGGDEARALQLVNGERAAAGLAPLGISGGARSVAQAWSAEMSGSGLAHNPDLTGDLRRAGVGGWTAAGENVGEGGSVDQLHPLFMGSAGHRANVLKPAYTHVGIGVVHSGGKVWVTMDFVG